MRLNWMSRFIMCTLGTHARPHYRNSPGLTHFWDPLLRQSLMAGLRILFIPEALWPYWNHRDTMTVEDGIILQGEAILIPPYRKGRNTTTDTQRTPGDHQKPVTCMQLCVLARDQQRYPTHDWSLWNMPVLPTMSITCPTQGNTHSFKTLAKIGNRPIWVWQKWLHSHCRLLF